MEWDEYTGADFLALNYPQAKAMAEAVTAMSRRLAEAEYANSIHEQTIYKLTGMDSVDATIKAHGQDFIEMSHALGHTDGRKTEKLY